MSITLREASEKVGVTRQTLMKAIKTGRVSGQKSDNGEWRIEPVELFRVWPPVNEVQQPLRSEEHTSELQSLMRISYAVFCLKKTINKIQTNTVSYKIHKTNIP